MEQLSTHTKVGIFMSSLALLLFYLFVNWEAFADGGAIFVLTTVGVFTWFILIELYLIYETTKELKRQMNYTIEDNLVEIKLLKELITKQVDEMRLVHDVLTVPKKSSKAKKKKRAR